jgi:hypothetical protein
VDAYLETRRRDGALADPRYAELIELLGLDPAVGRYRLRFGMGDGAADEITMQTRSLIETLRELASRISVPADDIEDGRTYPAPPVLTGTSGQVELAVQHRMLPPTDAFVAVEYDDDWFWIRNDDFQSKNTFTMLMLLFDLAAPGGDPRPPTITIPTG